MARLPALVAALLTAVLLTAAPARAESGSVADPAGDAPAYGDLRRVEVRNGPQRLAVVLTLASFQPERTSTYLLIERPGRPARTYAVGWTQDPAFPRHAALVRVTRDGLERIPCRGLRVQPDRVRATLSASVPQRCLGGAAPVAARALTEEPGGGDLDESSRLRLRVG